MPDNSSNANQMHISIASERPGFEVEILKLPIANSSTSKQSFFSGNEIEYNEIPISEWQLKTNFLGYKVYGASKEDPWQIIKFSELDFQFDPEIHIVRREFLLGTDKYGRDLLSRLILGARLSFSVGFISVLISLLIGIPLGAIAAYYGGWVDKLIMWFINVIWSIPTLLMVIAISLALGKGFWQVFVAVGFTMWVEVARVVRGQVMSIKEKEYVQAAKVIGLRDWKIIFKHIHPNAIAPVIVISAANFAAAILIESGLSFLGIGAQPPMPSWGGMIKDHYAYLIVDKAYLALAPGMAIMFLVLAFMMLGNALRDALDVRSV